VDLGNCNSEKNTSMLEKRTKGNLTGTRKWDEESGVHSVLSQQMTDKVDVQPIKIKTQTYKKLNQSLAFLCPLLHSCPPVWPQVVTPAFLQKSTDLTLMSYCPASPCFSCKSSRTTTTSSPLCG
jgi:hypothetical protein